METYVLPVLSVVFFCLSAHQFMRVMLTPVPVFNQTSFSKGALRIEKAYKTVSWAVMTIAFLLALVISFYQVFSEF